MAVLADYLVISKQTYGLKLVGNPEVILSFVLPSGVLLNRGDPLLHYNVVSIATPGFGNQMGITVDLNGTQIDRRFFIDTSQHLFVELILNDPPFNLTGQNTLRFRAASPTNDTQNSISFSSVVLWFQRDSASQD
jgi:hypothetical protein